jgi:copper chaperone CopZ
MAGVKSAEVSLKDTKATVVADSSQVSSQEIEDTVAEACGEDAGGSLSAG